MPTIATASVVGHAYGPADKFEKDGKTYAKVRFWTSDKIKGKEKKEFTSWSAFVSGLHAEWLLKSCQKGSLIFCSGTVRLSAFEKKDGTVSHAIEFVRVTECRCLDAREADGDVEDTSAAPAPRRPVPHVIEKDSEPPF